MINALCNSINLSHTKICSIFLGSVQQDEGSCSFHSKNKGIALLYGSVCCSCLPEVVFVLHSDKPLYSVRLSVLCIWHNLAALTFSHISLTQKRISKSSTHHCDLPLITLFTATRSLSVWTLTSVPAAHWLITFSCLRTDAVFSHSE